MSDLAASLQACAETVRKGDPDRFAATMATPAGLRNRLWPLYAANLEIARAPWASSEPMVSEMRLQWWIDALEGVGEGREPPHEIGAALVQVGAPARHLIAVAEARRADCWPEPIADAPALWAYLDQTAGSVYWAAAEALGGAPEAEPGIRSFGAAAGLASFFQAVPELLARARPPLADLSAPFLAACAREGLTRLDLMRKSRAIKGGARAALLPAWQARAQLKRVVLAPETVVSRGLERSEFSRRISLLRAALRGV